MMGQNTVDSSQDIYVPVKARIRQAATLTQWEKYFNIELASGEALGHMPGQFVEVSIAGVGEAPISVSSSPDQKDSFELVVRNVGRLTQKLHTLDEGAQLGVRGPFGTPFPVEDRMKGKDIVFICGGIGLVPVRSAIHYVLNRPAEYGNVAILYGAKTPAERLFTEELEAWNKSGDVYFDETVDKADSEWRGNVGVITTLIPQLDMDPDNTVVVVCGPPVMYKFVLIELFDKNIPQENIYVSLERRMKCGVGKCGHCQINGLYACLDGPVFQYSEIADAQEAI
ncbi:MAG: FAD/NAD(P)-binding protein [Lentisphaeria bacterium]